MPLFDLKPTKAKQVTNPTSNAPSPDKPNFMKEGQFTTEEEPIAALIQQRRIQMLIHSRLYYKCDYNVVSDMKFDKWARELAELQKKHPTIASRVCFAEAFEDWDGSTGAFLPLDHPWVVYKVRKSYGR